MSKSLGVVIARLQGLTDAHIEMLRFAKEQTDKQLILLGMPIRIDADNKFSFQDRISAIEANPDLKDSFIYQPIRDVGDDALWTNNVIHKVNNIATMIEATDVFLIGTKKDSSSYYLDILPYKLLEMPILINPHTGDVYHGTNIRKALMEDNYELLQTLTSVESAKVLWEQRNLLK